MDLQTLILFIIGLCILIAGAELLVRGASRLAVRGAFRRPRRAGQAA